MATNIRIPTEDLPLWMRQARRGVDWGVVVVFVFSLLAALPFLTQPGLPRTNASENHVFMAHDYATAIREGRLYPRWSSHVLQGYGAPIPNFYPPGTAYSAAAVEILFTNDTLTAVRLIYVLAITLAGTMTYVFVTRITGAGAGILASALYVYSPYLGHVAPYVMGDLPVVISLGLLPCLMWSLHRLITINARYDFALVGLFSAALLLTELHISIIGFVLAMTLILWLGWVQKLQIRLALLAYFTGFCLAAFFWLPALVEQDAIRWQAAEVMPRLFRLDLSTLLRPMSRVDLSELVTTPQFTIGLPLMIAIPLGGVALIVNRQFRGLHAPFLLLGIVFILIGSYLIPDATWLVGPMSFCLAVGGSSALGLKNRARLDSQRLYLPVFLLIVLYLSHPVWLAPHWPAEFGNLEPEAQLAYEQNGYGFAVLPPGVSIPTTLSPSLEANRALLSSYQSGLINRILPDQSQFGRRTSVIASLAHGDRFQIRVIDATVIDIARAFFPGWQAKYENQSIPVTQNSQTGLSQFVMPAGSNGDVNMSFGATPVRILGWVISWTTLLLICLGALRRQSSNNFYEDLRLLSISEARLTMLVTSGFICILFLFGLPFSPYSLHATPGHALNNSFAAQSRTETGLELLAYNFASGEFQPGDTLDLTLAWRTSRPLRENYQVQVQVIDVAQGAEWVETEPSNPLKIADRFRRIHQNAVLRDAF